MFSRTPHTASMANISARQPQLPPELHDHIVDHLEDDKRTLAACAVVCREWSYRSRYRLFRRLTITLPTTLDQLADFLHANTRLASYVQSLSLRGRSSPGDIMYDSQFHVTVQGIANCMALLPFADELSLQGVWWTDHTLPKAENPDTLRLSGTLKKLQMTKVFVTPDALFDTVCCFPQLQHLHTESVYWTMGIDRLEDYEHPAYGSPPLETLSLGSGCSYNMLKYFLPRLRERASVDNLRSVTLNFDHLDPSPETQRFMDCVGAGLDHLHVIFGNNVVINSGRFIDTLSLEHCQSLTKFEITLPGNLSSVVQPRFAWSLLSITLPKLSQTMQSLTIAHRLDLDTLQAHLRGWDWAQLDEALCSYPELKSVTIRAETTEFTSDLCEMYIFDSDDALYFWKDYIERSKTFFTKNLPQLTKRKVLSFQF